jgi:hypothetical protein
MRRTRLILSFLLVTAVLLGGLYTTYWFVAAGRIRAAVMDWAEARRVAGYTVGWDRLGIEGFPLVFRVRIDAPVLGDNRAQPGWEARGGLLMGEAKPWAPQVWQLDAPQGCRVAVQPGPARPAIVAEAASLAGDIAPARPADPVPDALAISLDGKAVTIAADATVRADRMRVSALLPAHDAASHRDVWAAGALRFEKLALPVPVRPLGAVVDSVDVRLAVKGTVPGGRPLRDALAAWRDAGGTAEVEALRFGWGPAMAFANGTLALDAAMQPVGALTAVIEGYGDVIDALVAGGSLKPGDAQLAKLALGLLAKPGPAGRSQLSVPVTLQEGQVYMGPAKLGSLPHFSWE